MCRGRPGQHRGVLGGAQQRPHPQRGRRPGRANPAKAGTPGGGSGWAIYNDGNRFMLTSSGTIIENNTANEGGGAVFFVSNDRTGTMSIDGSTLRRNKSGQFETAGFPGIFFLGARNPTVTTSTVA
jgi:hypothetical protein